MACFLQVCSNWIWNSPYNSILCYKPLQTAPCSPILYISSILSCNAFCKQYYAVQHPPYRHMSYIKWSSSLHTRLAAGMARQSWVNGKGTEWTAAGFIIPDLQVWASSNYKHEQRPSQVRFSLTTLRCGEHLPAHHVWFIQRVPLCSATVPWRCCGLSASRPRCGCVLRCSPCDPGTSCCASADSGRWWRKGWSRPHRSWWRARVAWPRCPERWWWSGGGSWIRLSLGSRSPRSERRGYWERSPYLSDAPPESDPR